MNLVNKLKSALTGFRKFLVILVIIAVTIWFRIAGLIDGGNFAEIMSTVGAAFMGANLVEHITDAIKKKMEK